MSGERDGSWRALMALPVALAALAGGTFVYAAGAAIRDGLVSAPVTQPGDAGAAAHGTPPVLTVFSTFAQDVILVAGVAIVVGSALGASRLAQALGLRPPARVWRAVGLMAAAYVVFLVVAAAWTSLLDISDRENVAVTLGTRDSPGALLAAIVVVCTIAPLAEELFFRGFLFGALRRYGVGLAAVLSGTLFGLAHVASSPIGFIVPLALFGILLALLYQATGSLYPSIGLHWLNNTIAFTASDGRAWLLPVAMGVSGGLILLVLFAATRFDGSRRAVSAVVPY